MAQEVSAHYEMAQARKSDCINVIFDKRSPASSASRSRSRSSCSSPGSRSRSKSSCSSHHSSRHSRGRGAHRRHYRSPFSSSSSSRSTSRSSRSRSHPRCHRHSSRCRCSNHRRYRKGHSRRSPPRRYRAHSRSYSRSPSVDRRRLHQSRSRSSSYSSRNRYNRVDKYKCQFSRSPPRSLRSWSRSRSSERSIAPLSVEEKRQLLEAARQSAMKNLGVQKLELPESVKPILMQQPVVSKHGFTGPETRVRQDSENKSKSTEVEDDAQSPRLSPKRGISFSTNNSVAKPTMCTQPCAKVTSLVDSVESKKPYGHWIPLKSARH